MNTPTQCGAIKPPKTDIYLRSTSLASLRFCVEAGANMRVGAQNMVVCADQA